MPSPLVSRSSPATEDPRRTHCLRDGRRCDIPSTSRRATTRRPGGQSFATSAGGYVEGCPGP